MIHNCHQSKLVECRVRVLMVKFWLGKKPHPDTKKCVYVYIEENAKLKVVIKFRRKKNDDKTRVFNSSFISKFNYKIWNSYLIWFFVQLNVFFQYFSNQSDVKIPQRLKRNFVYVFV